MEKSDFGYIQEGKVFRKAFLEFPDREIGELRDSEEQSMLYYEQRFELAKSQVETVKEKIETNTNKGSFLMKVLHLKETLCEFDAIGDFEKLYQTLNELHEELSVYIDANRHKNLQIKTALLEELKEVVKSHEWKSASLAIKEIQIKWIKTGAVSEEHKEKLETTYEEIRKDFYERRAAFYSDLEKMMADKEKDFEDFLKKAEELKTIQDLTQLKLTIKKYKEEWRALGKIKPAKHNSFWQQFQETIKISLESAKLQAKEKKKLGTKDNQKAKEALINKLEAASKDLLPNINLKQIQAEWKSIGSVGQETNNTLMEKYLFLSGIISEKVFLSTLLNKKAKKGMSDGDLNRLRVKLLRNLLDRDYNELRTFEENLGKFNMAKGLDGLLEKKLNQQKRKVDIKKAILGELKTL